MLKEFIFQSFPIKNEREFSLFPKCGDEMWHTCLRREELIKDADEAMEAPIPELTVSMFLEFFRTGSRLNYEEALERRKAYFRALILGRCVQPERDMIGRIADYVWGFCELTAWHPPAHNNHYYTCYPDEIRLPRFNAERRYVDLNTAATGALLALTYYLHREPLDQLSPQITERLVYEVTARVIDPILNYDDFGWMGLSAEGRINNWNPWIISNYLMCVFLLPMEDFKRRRCLNKAFLILDQFLNYYTEAGGCDEGPAYFLAAGAALAEALELIAHATDGAVDLFHEPKIRNMLDFMEYVTIFDKEVAPFGDNARRAIAWDEWIYYMGKRTDRPSLMSFALHRRRYGEKCFSRSHAHLCRTILSLMIEPEVTREMQNNEYHPERCYFLPDIMVMTAREEADGFTVVAKGGHNDESHNHNDLGEFIIYYGRTPIAVDPGGAPYTAKTFSPQRYEIPYMQSGHHNTVTVNGFLQPAGKEYFAAVSDFCDEDDRSCLSLDLTHAYPPEAGLTSWKRTVTLDRRSHTVRVQDDYELNGTAEWNLMLPGGEAVRKGDRLITASGCEIELIGTETEFSCSDAEDMPFFREKAWEGGLYHAVLRADCRGKGSLTMVFHPKGEE